MNCKIANSLIVEVLKLENREILTSDRFESPLNALYHLLTARFNSKTEMSLDEIKLTNEIGNMIHWKRLIQMNSKLRLPEGSRDDYNYDLD